MNAAESTLIYQWRKCLRYPARSCGGDRVATPQPRQAARCKLRLVLRQILADWSNLPPEKLPLKETFYGPTWQGNIGGEILDINLSYGSEEGWVGLIRGDGLVLTSPRQRRLPKPMTCAILSRSLGCAAIREAAILRWRSPWLGLGGKHALSA